MTLMERLKFFYRKSGLKRLVRRCFASYNRKVIRKDIRYLGENVEMGKGIDVAFPEFCIIGENINLGKGVKIENYNGAVICDGAVLAERVTLGDREAEEGKAIFIGQGAKIGAGKHLESGTFIESNKLINRKISSSTQKTKLRGDELGDKFFFIVCTGRSGSKTMSKTLSLHPEMRCRHEPNTLLLRLANDYIHGLESREETKRKLACIYTQCSVFPPLIYGESDQKVSFIIEILAELLPKSKFIWLLRNAHDFSRSAFNRSWYGPTPEFIANHEFPLVHRSPNTRIIGPKTQSIAQEDWDLMSAYEKCCWYWAFCNETIEQQLLNIDQSRWIQVKVEELQDEIPRILSFLEASDISLAVKTHNLGPKNALNVPDYEAILHRWCRKGMEKWYLDGN